VPVRPEPELDVKPVPEEDDDGEDDGEADTEVTRKEIEVLGLASAQNLFVRSSAVESWSAQELVWMQETRAG